jgi:16S rRNA (guanine966-N2)-methyltransferase
MAPGARISGGLYARRSIPVPRGVRPTEGRVREALLSIWGHDLAGLACLDLFAGSGAVSLEMAGRGAERVVAVEGDARVVRELQTLCRNLGVRNVQVWDAKLPGALKRTPLAGQRFDRVFADPPYAFDRYAELVESVAPLLAEDGEFVLELSRRSPPPESQNLARIDLRHYGETSLVRYAPQAEAPPPEAPPTV